MMKFGCLTVCLIASVAYAADLPTLKIDNSSISVSGLSAGGFMAVQFHVAFSSQVFGAGVVAGGPYYCAKGELTTATTTCMNFPQATNMQSLYEATNRFASEGKIDPTSNLANAKVWLYSGTKDTVVKSGSMHNLETYYRHYITTGNVSSEFSIPSEHGMPTLNYGNKCSKLGEPFIQDCNYDGAGLILKALYGSLNASGTANPSNIIEFDQGPYVPTGAKLGSNGYVYVPTACSQGATCKLHVVFHGCEQAPKNIGTKYVEHTGYNEWAETNNIVLLYPQCVASPIDENPNACFDWWGYTDKRTYTTKEGPQMKAFMNMISKITGASL